MSDFCYPVLPWKNYNNNYGKFLDPQYYKEIGSEHPGVDLNGNGGGNTDYGSPIYAVADGVVVNIQFYPVWGWMIEIEHAKHGVWSVYAHMCEVMPLKVGQAVNKKQLIGKMGRGANNVYISHLHFEIRKFGPAALPTNFWPSGKYKNRLEAQACINRNYLPPMNFLAQMQAEVV